MEVALALFDLLCPFFDAKYTRWVIGPPMGCLHGVWVRSISILRNYLPGQLVFSPLMIEQVEQAKGAVLADVGGGAVAPPSSSSNHHPL